MLRKFLFATLACASAFAQQPGTLTPSVATKADAQQTYALYVPAHYDLSKPMPVVYIFDPGARGAIAAQRFTLAADTYGMAIAASNVSHNGPAEPQIAALQAMSADVEARLPIDTHRRYVAGFSGGARAAILAGIVCPKCFAGILAFGAGLPSAPKLTETPFALLLGVGNGDFNYAEVVGLAPQLDKLHATYRIFTFEGSHDWPTPEQLSEAMQWIEFQAVKQGLSAKSAKYPDADYTARLEAAQKLAAANPLQATREYDSIIRDFHDVRDSKEASTAAAQLRSSPDFKKAQKEEKAIAEKTADLSDHFDQMVQMLLAAQGTFEKQPPRTEAVRTINQMIADAASKDRFQSTVARRALSSSFVTLLQLTDTLKPTETDNAVELADLATIMRPDSAEAYYGLALAQLRAGRRKNAAAAIKRSIELGTPKAKVEADPRLKTIIGEI